MFFDPVIAATRFGSGLSPRHAAPQSAAAMIDALAQPDAMAQRYPIMEHKAFLGVWRENNRLRQASKRAKTDAEQQAAKRRFKEHKRDVRGMERDWFHNMLLRRLHAPDGFRERLTAFWADHFTVRGSMFLARAAILPYVEETIRPRLTGRFEDMLFEAVTHPAMTVFLDQVQSMGPRSKVGLDRKKRGKTYGLNENLARELLELHTMGADGPYTQTDVHELAELLTGLTATPDAGRVFRAKMAEPGLETVLGKSYGGREPRLVHIRQVITDLARHPATARHISWKLAVHFIADAPPGALVEAMTEAYIASGGHLIEVYAAMLGHPDVWRAEKRNIKPPLDFMASALRALDVDETKLPDWTAQNTAHIFIQPMRVMGHHWGKPAGPDGLHEDDGSWMTPQALAMRIQWSMQAPQRLVQKLPDPRVFVETALGPSASPKVRFAAQSAESVPEAIGLVLMSPEFQRV